MRRIQAGDGPLHRAARNGLEGAVRVLLEGKADIEAVTGQCNAALEAIIRQYPEQWLWSNRRFRHSPDLVGDGYTDRVKKHAVG